MASLVQWNEGGHAIYRATFAIEFSPMPPPAVVRELLALHGSVKQDYPRRQETQGIGVKLGIDEWKNPTAELEGPDQTTKGFAFDSLEPNGEVARAIRLDPMPPNNAALSVVRSDYARWDQTWNEVRSIFALMAPALLARARVVGLQLQFHDRFLWRESPDAFRADMLLRAGSIFLVPNAFEVTGPWHSYHGYFEQYNDPIPHHLLNVVEAQARTKDASLPDREFGFLFDVNMKHRIPVTGSEEVFGSLDTIAALMEEMHDRDKWVLSHIINDDMCDLIKLPKPEQSS